MTALAPLEDPTYEPKHPPTNGAVPPVVAKWGPRSQLRWFTRFSGQLARQPGFFWADFYCESVEHTGMCCSSCVEDVAYGYADQMDVCCCKAVTL